MAGNYCPAQSGMRLPDCLNNNAQITQLLALNLTPGVEVADDYAADSDLFPIYLDHGTRQLLIIIML